MQAKLKAGEIDVCIGEWVAPGNLRSRSTDLNLPVALTDALIAGIANGQTSYKIVGRYISTPLRWYVDLRHPVNTQLTRDPVYRAIITGKDSQYQDVNDLKGTKLGISRLGRSEIVLEFVIVCRSNVCRYKQWISSHGLRDGSAGKMVPSRSADLRG
jgi:hypothetical protein